MWVTSGIVGLSFVRENVGDGSEGEHDEAERGIGCVKAISAVDD